MRWCKLCGGSQRASRRPAAFSAACAPHPHLHPAPYVFMRSSALPCACTCHLCASHCLNWQHEGQCRGRLPYAATQHLPAGPSTRRASGRAASGRWSARSTSAGPHAHHASKSGCMGNKQAVLHQDAALFLLCCGAAKAEHKAATSGWYKAAKRPAMNPLAKRSASSCG